MRILAFETCAPTGGVSLLEDGRILAHSMVTSSKAHSRLLTDNTQRLLEFMEFTWDDIDVVAVSRGPGSFTGVRLGLTIAKALCEQGHPKLVLVDTLVAMAKRAYCGEKVDGVLALLNARKGEVYGQYFDVQNQELILKNSPFVAEPHQLSEHVSSSGNVLICGEGFRAYESEIKENFRCKLIISRPQVFDLHPDCVAFEGYRLALEGRYDDVQNASPVYLRDASVSTPKKAPI